MDPASHSPAELHDFSRAVAQIGNGDRVFHDRNDGHEPHSGNGHSIEEVGEVSPPFGLDQGLQGRSQATENRGSDAGENPSNGVRRRKSGRRGPMDVMRQLFRILLKLFPQSVTLVSTKEEANGGNRISEAAVNKYLEGLLGSEAPRPVWGLPGGWSAYVSELLTWASGREITPDDVERFLQKPQGKGWFVANSELDKMKLHPSAWPLPLKMSEILQVESLENPVPIPFEVKPKLASSSFGSQTKRQKELAKMNEMGLWSFILEALIAVQSKQGTDEDQDAVEEARSAAKQKFDEIVLSVPFYSHSYQYLPAVTTVDPTSLFNQMMHLPLPAHTEGLIHQAQSPHVLQANNTHQQADSQGHHNKRQRKDDE